MTYRMGSLASGRRRYPVRGKSVPCWPRSWIRSARPFRMRFPLWITGGTLPRIGAKDPACGRTPDLFHPVAGEGRDLCPMEQGFHYRLADLFLDKYRLSGEPEDLESTFASTGGDPQDQPVPRRGVVESGAGVPDTSDRARGRGRDAPDGRFSMEPNFCRGYAKLAELTKGKDEPQSRAWEARAEKCREAARGRTLEEERTLAGGGTRTPVRRRRRRGTRTGSPNCRLASPRRADPPFRRDLPSGHERPHAGGRAREFPLRSRGDQPTAGSFFRIFGTSSGISSGLRRCRFPGTGR